MSRISGDYADAMVLRGQRIRVKSTLRHRRIPLSLIVLCTAVVLTAFMCVWSSKLVIHTAYTISTDNRDMEALSHENRKLGLEISTLRSPQNLGRAALALGLHEPASGQVARIK